MTTAAAALAAYTADADLRAAKGRLGEALPDSGWLADYLAAVTPLTDAPVEFHLASGMAALAGAVGNRMHVESWGQTVYPHLWAVLVAPSSFWRKSTSINTAEALLRAGVPEAALPDDFSREKFLSTLEDKPTGLLTIKEFGGFLATLNLSYMAGLKEILTGLYDAPDLYRRDLQKKTIEIHRPAVSILAATTLDWLESKITEGDLRGGFLARFLFVTASQKASAKGLTGAMDPLARMRLVDGLHELGGIPDTQPAFSPATRKIVNDWMGSWEDEVGQNRHRTDLSGFAVRLQTYVLKFAMLYRASAVAGVEPEAVAELDETCVRQAIAYCRVLWRNVAALIDDEVAVTQDARELRRLRGIIGSGIDRSTALRLSKLKVRDFDGYIATLVDGHEVTRERRRASELGLERAHDRELEWLSPVVGLNGRDGWRATRSVPEAVPVPDVIQFPGTEGEPKGTGTGNRTRNSTDPESPNESPFTSTSLSLSISSDDGAHIRAQGEEDGNRNRTASRRRRSPGVGGTTPPGEAESPDPLDIL